MARVPLNKPAAHDPDPSWLTFPQVVEWIRFRRIEDHSLDHLVWPGDPSDEDRDQINMALRDLRRHLASGECQAFGETDAGDHAPIHSVEWSTRKVRLFEFPLKNYRIFRLSRVDVERLWPITKKVEHRTPERRGRPLEIDWDKMKELAMAGAAARPGISRNKLAGSLVNDYQTKVDRNRKVAKRGIEAKLKEWNIPS